MSNGMNKVFLMGNLSDEPDVRQFASGVRLKLSLATTEKYRDKNDVLQEVTQWHKVSLWGKRAEGLGRILSKGDRIVVEGRLETHSYEDDDGNTRYFTEVKARDIMLAGGPRPRGGGMAAGDAREEPAIAITSRPKSELASREAVL